MRYGTAATFRQALEAHLRQEAASRRTSVVRLRKLVTFDRLLARLCVAAPDRWILKGALAIEFRTSARGRLSSRAKDLADILLLKAFARLDAARLRRALSETFAVRGTHRVPETLPRPPAAWRPAYRSVASAVGIEKDLEAAFREAAAFVDPVLQSESQRRWDPGRGEWVATCS